MSDLRIIVPESVYAQLQANNVSVTAIRQAVIKTLKGLAEMPPTPKQKRGETASDYFVRVILERNGGVPPSLDEPYVKGYTRRQWFALSDQEQQTLWDKWHRQAEKEIDKKYGEGIDVRIENLAGQERSHKNLARAREKRAGYRTKRRGTKRA